MDWLLQLLARAFVRSIWALPLRGVARLGRLGGSVAWWLDGRHRRIAVENLTLALGEDRPPAEILALARENFRRLGENYASAVKTSGMSAADLAPHFEFVGAEKFLARTGDGRLASRVVAIGHFGNFELFARAGERCPGYQCATTYRGLPNPALNREMQNLRERSGCLFFERRRQGAELRAAMVASGLLLGLLSDQHAGDTGLRLPFFGRECSTSAAPALFALRYHCPLHVAVCFRVGLGRWRIEVGDEIPTRLEGRPRDPAAIMADVNRSFENAIRRDPANWFWVHRRWKPAPRTKSRRRSAVAPLPAAG